MPGADLASETTSFGSMSLQSAFTKPGSSLRPCCTTPLCSRWGNSAGQSPYTKGLPDIDFGTSCYQAKQRLLRLTCARSYAYLWPAKAVPPSHTRSAQPYFVRARRRRILRLGTALPGQFWFAGPGVGVWRAGMPVMSGAESQGPRVG
eukprot:2171259-Rhodomonas_salina.3